MRHKLVTVVVSREELVARKKRDGRNIYHADAQRKLVEACLQPGVSVSGMALAHGLNANVLRKWLIREHKRDETSQRRPVEKRAQSAPRLLAVTMLPVPAPDTLVPTTEKSPPPSQSPTPSTTASNGDAAGRINIEISGARIIVDANVNATALSTVLDCLRGTNSR
jgi:transposase